MSEIKITLTRAFPNQAEVDHFKALFEKNVVAWENSWTIAEEAVAKVEGEVESVFKGKVLERLEAEARKYATAAGDEIKDVWEYFHKHLITITEDAPQDGGANDGAMSTDTTATESSS